MVSPKPSTTTVSVKTVKPTKLLKKATNLINDGMQQTAGAVNKAATSTVGAVNLAANTTAGAMQIAASSTAEAMQVAATSTAGVMQQAANTTAGAVQQAANTTAATMQQAANTTAGAAQQAANSTVGAVTGAAASMSITSSKHKTKSLASETKYDTYNSSTFDVADTTSKSGSERSVSAGFTSGEIIDGFATSLNITLSEAQTAFAETAEYCAKAVDETVNSMFAPTTIAEEESEDEELVREREQNDRLQNIMATRRYNSNANNSKAQLLDSDSESDPETDIDLSSSEHHSPTLNFSSKEDMKAFTSPPNRGRVSPLRGRNGQRSQLGRATSDTLDRSSSTLTSTQSERTHPGRMDRVSNNNNLDRTLQGKSSRSPRRRVEPKTSNRKLDEREILRLRSDRVNRTKSETRKQNSSSDLAKPSLASRSRSDQGGDLAKALGKPSRAARSRSDQGGKREGKSSKHQQERGERAKSSREHRDTEGRSPDGRRRKGGRSPSSRDLGPGRMGSKSPSRRELSSKSPSKRELASKDRQSSRDMEARRTARSRSPRQPSNRSLASTGSSTGAEATRKGSSRRLQSTSPVRKTSRAKGLSRTQSCSPNRREAAAKFIEQGGDFNKRRNALTGDTEDNGCQSPKSVASKAG